MAPGPMPADAPPRIDRQILRVAFAYDALPVDVFQRLRLALAGDHNIAQALETAQEVVKALSADELAFVLARLLVCTSDAID
ncbi:hypothetical protein ACS5PK_01070 [Roseateles sp. DB2]|uniref:hypothetical protein n=1 Tax=Roseateles sp. DB2 TaxID=3453717 RepID=UPI003EE9F66C